METTKPRCERCMDTCRMLETDGARTFWVPCGHCPPPEPRPALAEPFGVVEMTRLHQQAAQQYAMPPDPRLLALQARNAKLEAFVAAWDRQQKADAEYDLYEDGACSKAKWQAVREELEAAEFGLAAARAALIEASGG